jgi:hypothetical protein
MRYRLLVLAGLIASIPLLVAPTAAPHFDPSSKWTWGSGNCAPGTAVDPINVVFYNWGTTGGSYDRVANQVVSHTGSWVFVSGTGQNFKDHGDCYSMHGQRASGGNLDSRFHVRFRGQHEDPGPLKWTATAGAHHEDIIWCGHAVDQNGPGGSGFDQGRQELVNRVGVASGHTFYYSWWGNTATMYQCDGSPAASDGATAFILLHQVNH